VLQFSRHTGALAPLCRDPDVHSLAFFLSTADYSPSSPVLQNPHFIIIPPDSEEAREVEDLSSTEDQRAGIPEPAGIPLAHFQELCPSIPGPLQSSAAESFGSLPLSDPNGCSHQIANLRCAESLFSRGETLIFSPRVILITAGFIALAAVVSPRKSRSSVRADRGEGGLMTPWPVGI